nr:ankyrin repeat domain-containing protein [Wolbachia endosymbiont of Cimex lectularius]
MGEDIGQKTRWSAEWLRKESRRQDEESRRQDEELRRQDEELRRQDEESRRQDEESRHQDEESKRQDEELRRQDEELRRQDEESRRQDEESRHQDEESKRQDEELRRQDEELRRQDEELRRQDEELRRQDEELRRQDEELRRQDEESRRQDEESRHQDEESKRQDEELRRQDEELRRQDEESRRQDEESRRQDEESRRQDEESRRQDEELRRQDEESRRQDELKDSIIQGDFERCRSLIEGGVDVNVKFLDSTTPVKRAIEHDREKILGFLIEEGAEISFNAALSDAIKHGSKRIFDCLLNKYADKVDINHQDKGGNTALHHALQGFIRDESKYKNFAESLLGKGAKLDVKNNKNETPFDLLIGYVEKYSYEKAQGLTFVLELLSKHENKNALKELKYKGDTPALNKLLELAVKYNSQGAFKSLLDQYDIDINYQDKNRDTALHHALKGFIDAEYDSSKRNRYKSFAESLLSKGAKLDIKNNKNETPFDLLIDYVKKYSSEKAQRLTTVLELLDKCKNKDALKELRCKDGTPALDKLKKLESDFDRSYSTFKNSKVGNVQKNLLPESTFNNSLWYVIGAIAGAAIGAALAYSITDAFSVIIAAVVIGSLLGMAITYGVSKCLEQPKIEHITKEPYVS